MKKEPGAKSGQRLLIPIFIGVIFLLLIVVGVMVWQMLSRKDRDITALKQEPNIITSMTPEDTAALLKKQQEDADRNRISVAMPTTFQFSSGTAEATLEIENKEENKFDFIVEFVLDDTNETVLQTGLIPPGSILDKGKLSVDLDPGEYPAAAIFTTFENDEPVAKTGLAIKIIVNS